MTTIRASKLTTFSVAPDGASISLGVADDRGAASDLVLPTSCLQALVMTLPEMAQQALRRKYADPAVRLVFPVDNWAIETSQSGDRLILTLATADGFRASFALSTDEMARIADTALTGEAIASIPAPICRPH
ncbi:MAG TPA: hypothetical protein VNF99_02145 [Stellaceae bacterium]|nr:hypothetical protein [Stellaceae bacterium]